VLDEFGRRVAPHTVSAWHPRSFGYFTPPPLLASVAGEVLSQVAQQGIDIWHAGPIGAFVEEEVVRWLCDLVGYGESSFGLLASGGVMANFIAMALVRDVHLRTLTAAPRPPRGAALEGVRVYTGDQTHLVRSNSLTYGPSFVSQRRSSRSSNRSINRARSSGLMRAGSSPGVST